MEITVQSNKDILLIPIELSDHDRLFNLMQEVYKSAYQDFWTDGEDWYLDLCYSPENLKKGAFQRDGSHYFFVEYQGLSVGILKYDFPFSPKKVDIPNAMKLHRLYLDQSVYEMELPKI